MVTLIDHDLWAALDVSVSEYCVLYFVQTTDAQVSRKQLVNNLRFDPKTVDYLVHRLTDKGFLERVEKTVRHAQTQHVILTQKFYDIVNSPIPAKVNLVKSKKNPKFKVSEGFSSWQPTKRIGGKA